MSQPDNRPPPTPMPGPGRLVEQDDPITVTRGTWRTLLCCFFCLGFAFGGASVLMLVLIGSRR